MNLESCRQIFERKSFNIKLHQNPFIESGVVPSGRRDGRTDGHEAKSHFSQFCEHAQNIYLRGLTWPMRRDTGLSWCVLHVVTSRWHKHVNKAQSPFHPIIIFHHIGHVQRKTNHETYPVIGLSNNTPHWDGILLLITDRQHPPTSSITWQYLDLWWFCRRKG
jgi:hypothetical protein